MLTAASVAFDLLAALSYDPQIRGAWIVLLSVLILCGSVYLLLMTNTGARLGFLLAATGLVGWMATMGWIWVVYGIGLKGDAPSWVVEEVVTGDNLADITTIDVVRDDFPEGWERLAPAELGEAQATADAVLIPATGAAAHGEEGTAAAEVQHFEPVFDALDDYTFVAGFSKGGEDYFIPGGYLKRSQGFFQGWFHEPHYAIVQVSPTIEEPDIGGAPAPVRADPSRPITSVVMVRDLGNLRLPSFLLALSMTVLFAALCWQLHRRDKAVMAARADAGRP